MRVQSSMRISRLLISVTRDIIHPEEYCEEVFTLKLSAESKVLNKSKVSLKCVLFALFRDHFVKRVNVNIILPTGSSLACSLLQPLWRSHHVQKENYEYKRTSAFTGLQSGGKKSSVKGHFWPCTVHTAGYQTTREKQLQIFSFKHLWPLQEWN